MNNFALNNFYGLNWCGFDFDTTLALIKSGQQTELVNRDYVVKSSILGGSYYTYIRSEKNLLTGKMQCKGTTSQNTGGDYVFFYFFYGNRNDYESLKIKINEYILSQYQSYTRQVDLVVVDRRFVTTYPSGSSFILSSTRITGEGEYTLDIPNGIGNFYVALRLKVAYASPYDNYWTSVGISDLSISKRKDALNLKWIQKNGYFEQGYSFVGVSSDIQDGYNIDYDYYYVKATGGLKGGYINLGDITNYNTLRIRGYSSKNDSYTGITFHDEPNKYQVSGDIYQKVTYSTYMDEFVFDISGYTGESCISVYANVGTIYIQNISLE